MPSLFRTTVAAAAAACALALVTCSTQRGRVSAVPEDTFVECYAGILIVKEEGTLTGLDTSAVSARSDSVCSRYGVTRGQIREELAYYRENPARWKGILDKVIGRLERLQRETRPSPP